MLVTLQHFFRPRITEQYPDTKPYLPDRYRGGEFEWYEERCTGCSICAKVCPNGVINVETHELEDGSRYIDRYDMDLMVCLFCGYCAEACPFGAIYVGSNYEGITTYRRPTLFYDKQRLHDTLERTRAAATRADRNPDSLIWTDSIALRYAAEHEAAEAAVSANGARANGAKPDAGQQVREEVKAGR